MDIGNENINPIPLETTKPIETPNGKGIFVFRYENPQIPNSHANSPTSKTELIGKWFTDSLRSLETYISTRQPGGRIIIASIEKEDIEPLRATNNPTAQDMDIEYDNFILTNDLIQNAQIVELDVIPSSPSRFTLQDRLKIHEFINGKIIPFLTTNK